MDNIPQLDSAGLRRFGLLFGLIIAGVFGALLPLLLGLGFRWWPWLAGGIFVAWALLAPGSMNPFYRLWMRLGLMMNAVMGRLVLGIVFFLVVLPTGLILKLRGKDPMARKRDSQASSYRVPSTKTEAKNMERPF